MTKQRSLEVAVTVVGLWMAGACDLTLGTGRVGRTSNAPNSDGTCAAGLSVCGKVAYAQCLNLQDDHDHCGGCDNACVTGIACAAGTCQQIACTGSVTVTTQPLPEIIGDAGPGAYGLIFADVNGDRHPDLVTWDAPGLAFQVSLGEAGGGFGAASTYQAAPIYGGILAVDWNSDGYDDLYVGNGLDSSCGEIWLGHPDGVLTSNTLLIDDAGCVQPMLMADLNGDGVMDMVVYNPRNSDPPGVLLADANGAFHVETFLAVKHYAPTLVRDWNGDGFPDLVAAGQGLSVYLNKGNGTFEDEMDCGVLISGAAVVADFDRDGHFDVATSMTDGRVGVLMGLGGCQFQPATEYPVSGPVANVVYADLDGDGTGDLAVQTNDGGVYLLHGRGDGTFQVALLWSGSACSTCWLLVGDVTGDGKPDLVAAGVSTSGLQLVPQPVHILENTCP